jgi:hypothetical protein
MSELTLPYLHSLFEYRDGKLFWKKDRARGKVKSGAEAGCLTSSGYHRLMLDYKEYPTHRIIFMMHHGYIPKVIDHIDGNTKNNKIENLRESCSQTNQYNRKLGKNNTSGCKNVSFNKRNNLWQIHIRCNKKVHSWYVESLELAELVAYEARVKFHGAFVNHG